MNPEDDKNLVHKPQPVWELSPETWANVIWADREKEPPDVVRIGLTRIPLPSPDQQKAGFYSDHATRLVRSIKGYKFIVPKG